MSSSLLSPNSIATRTGSPGPWGELEYYDAYLEAPDPLLKLLSIPSQHTVWNFVDQTPFDITKLLISAKLSPENFKILTDQKRWSVHGNVVRIFPPAQVVESLSPASRATIYRVLAEWEQNAFHRYPIVFEQPDLLQALDRSGLQKDLVRTIAALTYPGGGATLFSDLPALLRYVKSPQQENQLIRLLTRTRTLIVRLRLSEATDLVKLASYWTVDQRQTESLPLLTSIVQTRGVERLDIAHLLPAAARSQLYTFPSLSDALTGRAPDGFWTALNFFNLTPVPIYGDSPSVNQYVRSLYEPIQPPFRLGDVLVIAPKSGQRPGHACVYIADDIVYTKNSANFFSPWVLMKLRDVVGYHIREAEAIISAWRRKN